MSCPVLPGSCLWVIFLNILATSQEVGWWASSCILSSKTLLMQKLNKYISCLLDDTTPTTGLGTFSSPPQLSPVLTVLVDTLGLLLGTRGGVRGLKIGK